MLILLEFALDYFEGGSGQLRYLHHAEVASEIRTVRSVIVLLNPSRGGHGIRRSKRMRSTRRNHAAGFKAQVAVAAIKGDKTLAELAEQFDVHPNQISEWKQPLIDSAANVFGGSAYAKAAEPDLKVLHAKIGQLTLEHDCCEGRAPRRDG